MLSPNLATMAQKYLGIVASSVPSMLWMPKGQLFYLKMWTNLCFYTWKLTSNSPPVLTVAIKMSMWKLQAKPHKNLSYHDSWHVQYNTCSFLFCMLVLLLLRCQNVNRYSVNCQLLKCQLTGYSDQAVHRPSLPSSSTLCRMIVMAPCVACARKICKLCVNP